MFPPVASIAPHSPPAFRNPIGQASYILQDNQPPLSYGAPYSPPLQAQVYPPVGLDDRLVHGIEPLTTDIEAFCEAIDFLSYCLRNH